MVYTATHAVLGSLILAISYVAVVYLPNNRTTALLTRDNPIIIKRRLFSVTCLTGLALLLVPLYLTYQQATASVWQGVSLLGVVPGLTYRHSQHHPAPEYQWSVAHLIAYLHDISKAGLLVAGLFIGPLLNEVFFELQGYYHGPLVGPDAFGKRLMEELQSLQGVRNLIVGPLSEEIIYRCCVIALFVPVGNKPHHHESHHNDYDYHESSSSTNSIGVDVLIWITPLFFGIAHLHHGWELYHRHQHTLGKIVFSCFFQMCYTTLFGAFSAFLFLRTGNGAAVVLVHSMCNFFGFPTLNPDTDKKWWKCVYLALLVVGIWLFKMLLFPLTASPNSPLHWH